MADVFISYSRDDAKTARLFADGFQSAGLTVWWDDALRSGEAFDESIERALREAKAVVVLWSTTSVTSRWVRAEATQADRNRTLVPVMIEACQRPIIFELTHTADLSHWHGNYDDKAWHGLLADVLRLIEARPSGARRRRSCADSVDQWIGHPMVQQAGHRNFEKLLRCGVRLFEYPHTSRPDL
jgi:hypothetical protein